jgi:hypothetical protein
MLDGCSNFKWVKKVNNPKLVIVGVLTEGGKMYLVPRETQIIFILKGDKG